jgi:hypothetical protein
MRWWLPAVGVLLGGLVLGLGVGWLAIGRAQVPDAPPGWPDALVPAAPPGAPPSAAAAAAAQVDSPAGRRAQLPAAAAQSPAPAARAPAQPAEASAETPPPAAGFDPIAISLIPRGPGRYAILDLAAVDIPQVDVRQGVLSRNGAASWAQFAKRPRLTVLRDPQVRVELLHVGFDREAVPVVAHIRTTGHAGGEVEGMIPLRVGDVQLPMRADPSDSPEL